MNANGVGALFRAAGMATLLAACASARPRAPSAPPRVPASAAPEEVIIDVDERAPEPAPSRSLLLTRPRTIGGGDAAARKLSYVGRRIDLDVKSADVQDICRLLADVGKVNIVLGDDVKGTVTVRLHNVPWDQALDAILSAKGYRAEREGGVIVVR